ncbi:MAG: prolipoprotein diacylglyceryl transferase [Planctomycetota bacterium]|nr:prolipoprotein diacylglyceryl transferase [Planctomycetota bacterium]
MRQTLFYLPHEIGPLKLFGLVSWSMLGLVLYLGITLFYSYRQPKGISNLYEGFFNWIVGAAVLGFVLPAIEAKVAPGTADQIVVGLPVRGYGMMMMLGVLTAVGISYRRVMQLGVAKESFLGLVLWTVIGGLLGARLFYIVQKWSELEGTSIVEKLWTALQFTEGGLVVYGAILGGIAGILGWTLLQKVAPLSLLDAIVPAFFIGLAFGRIGCLMNGCCYGGVVESGLPAIEFPRGAPAYMDQLSSGRLLGIHTKPTDAHQTAIDTVDPGSWAERNGIQPGQILDSVQVGLVPLAPQRQAEAMRKHAPAELEGLVRTDRVRTVVRELPTRSLPVHPSQIYASITGFLLCFWSLCIPRWVQRPGLVFGSGWLVYGILRFLEEIVRVDEGGQFGTELSIAQWVSIVGILFGAILTVYSWSRSRAKSPIGQTAV